MPEPLADCTTALVHLAQEATLLAGCWQAEATRKAGKLALQGAHWGGYATVMAGTLALIGGGFIFATTRYQAGYQRCDMRVRIANSYMGEVSAWRSFLHENDVVGTLRKRAEKHARLYFHPGENWLKLYSYDPSSIGLFGEKLSADIAKYYGRMRSEIGRLIWMHRLSDKEISDHRAHDNDWLVKQQHMSADNLQSLIKLGDSLVQRLVAERDHAAENMIPAA